jgi:hypothetical protein
MAANKKEHSLYRIREVIKQTSNRKTTTANSGEGRESYFWDPHMILFKILGFQ